MVVLRGSSGRRLAVLTASCLFFIWWLLNWGQSDALVLFPWSISNSPSLFDMTDIFDDPPADSEAIRSMCSRTEWNKDLVFTCNDSGGGVGNLRNSILNCVRYAISAGAGMTMPNVILRNPDNIAQIWNRERIPFDYIFDRPHFVESLRLSCPQLSLYNTTEDIPNYSNINASLSLLPEKLDTLNPQGLDHPHEWRSLFYTWLSNITIYYPTNPANVYLQRSYLQYPIYSDPEEFALSLGKILKFRSDARILATTTLKNLVRKYNLSFPDVASPIWNKGIGFFGAHLRTEIDSQKGWPWQLYEYSKYSTQSKYYLTQAASSPQVPKPVIYLASGSTIDTEQFTSDAFTQYNLTVTDKHSLLTGTDKEILEKMSFDQQALVDYLVLLKSKDFAGVGHSSFAWNIALWRHQWAERRDHLNGPQLMSDELSQVYGTVRQYEEYAACLWP